MFICFFLCQGIVFGRIAGCTGFGMICRGNIGSHRTIFYSNTMSS